MEYICNFYSVLDFYIFFLQKRFFLILWIYPVFVILFCNEFYRKLNTHSPKQTLHDNKRIWLLVFTPFIKTQKCYTKCWSSNRQLLLPNKLMLALLLWHPIMSYCIYRLVLKKFYFVFHENKFNSIIILFSLSWLVVIHWYLPHQRVCRGENISNLLKKMGDWHCLDNSVCSQSMCQFRPHPGEC